MNKSLFHIEKEYLELMDIVQEAEGELTPELAELLAINEHELTTKGTNYGFIIRGQEHDISAIDAEMKRLAALKKSKVNLIDKLKENLTNAMNLYGVDEIKSELLKINFRKSTSLVSEYEIDIDELKKNNPLFVTTKVTETINKTEITNVIKSGINVVGFRLQENKNIQIK